MKQTLLPILASLALTCTPALAVITFTEDFDSGNSNWGDAVSTPATWTATGGAPGSSPGHVSTDFAFADAGPFGATVFRGQSGLNSSGGAFAGNWLDDNVSTFSYFVRHNAPVPVSYSTRFAFPVNSPGGIAANFTPILPNTWTLISVSIEPTNPAFVSFSGSNFNAVFSDIGNIQVFTSVPTGFEMNTTEYTFQLDSATVTIPEPSVSILGLLGGLALLSRKRTS